MTPKEIAAKILDYRRTSGLLMPGQLTSDIGAAAVGEALNRSWIIPDTETGYLMLTTEQSRIAEMQELAGADEESKQESQDDGGRSIAMSHASRRLNETAAYGSGQAPAPVQAPTPVTEPRTDTSMGSSDSGDLSVGEDVTIAEEGKAYQAKVKAVNDDGTYDLSFGAEKPPVERKYRQEEVQRAAST